MQSAVLRIHDFRTAIKTYTMFLQGCAVGDEQGDGPGHPRQWFIQRVELQKVHFIKVL